MYTISEENMKPKVLVALLEWMYLRRFSIPQTFLVVSSCFLIYLLRFRIRINFDGLAFPSVSFHMELFHIERGFYSRTEIGEREMEGKTA